MTWTPLSGQHQDSDAWAAFVVCDSWRRHEKRLLATLGGASLARQKPEGAVLAHTTMGAAEVEGKARELLQEVQRAACAEMIPGSAKRSLQVNTTFEDFSIQAVLVPAWELEVEDGGRVHRGWVDAASGRVHANKVASYKRIAAITGVVMGLAAVALLALFVMSALSGQVLLAAAEAERLERERVAEEELRAMEEEWDSTKAELSVAVAAGEDALAQREPGDARAAVSEASGTLQRLTERLEDPDLDALWTRCQVLDAGIEHVGAIRRGIEATKVVISDRKKCTTPLEIQTAWADLQLVGPEEAERREAASLTRSLERCRAKTERELSAGLGKMMMDQRIAMAPKMERSFLDDGLDVRVSVEGTNKDRLRMTWVLFGRATVHQMTDGGAMRPSSFLRNLQDAGFRKVTFSDGFSESIFYDLET